MPVSSPFDMCRASRLCVCVLVPQDGGCLPSARFVTATDPIKRPLGPFVWVLLGPFAASHLRMSIAFPQRQRKEKPIPARRIGPVPA